MLIIPGINISHLKKKIKQNINIKILVCGDILWFVREMSEFPVLLSHLFSSRFFLKNVEFWGWRQAAPKLRAARPLHMCFLSSHFRRNPLWNKDAFEDGKLCWKIFRIVFGVFFLNRRFHLKIATMMQEWRLHQPWICTRNTPLWVQGQIIRPAKLACRILPCLHRLGRTFPVYCENWVCLRSWMRDLSPAHLDPSFATTPALPGMCWYQSGAGSCVHELVKWVHRSMRGL